jgi:hypothetical protein
LRRLKKAVAWCYCQLSVSRHLATPSLAQRQFYLSAGTRERFGPVILRNDEIRTLFDSTQGQLVAAFTAAMRGSEWPPADTARGVAAVFREGS